MSRNDAPSRSQNPPDRGWIMIRITLVDFWATYLSHRISGSLSKIAHLRNGDREHQKLCCSRAPFEVESILNYTFVFCETTNNKTTILSEFKWFITSGVTNESIIYWHFELPDGLTRNGIDFDKIPLENESTVGLKLISDLKIAKNKKKIPKKKRWQLCWWNRYVGDLMMVTILRCWSQKKYVGDIFLYVGDIPIGHQHHNMPEFDVGDWYLMLVPNSRCWWRDLSPTFKSYHQHIWSPTSVTNIDVTVYQQSSFSSESLKYSMESDLIPRFLKFFKNLKNWLFCEASIITLTDRRLR